MTYSYAYPTSCDAGPLGPNLSDVCSGSSFVIFMAFLDSFIRSNNKISGLCDRVKPVESTNSEYDYIVIGGGCAGAVVAARLSEIPSANVLLLEAGSDEPAGLAIPSFSFKFLGTKIDWNYTTTNESNACLSNGGSCPWPAGKNLGGSMVHGGAFYERGLPTQYNNWAARGNYEWEWDKVKEYFVLLEANKKIDRVGRKNHRTGGPLPVQSYPYISPFDNFMLAAAEEVGYGLSENSNEDKHIDFAVVRAVINNGVKYSTAAAYLRPIKNRKRLHISVNSLVTRLIIEDKKVVGVEYYKNGEFKTVRATKEVIISAGPIGSPHLLLLSGIGPREHLETIGTNVVKDLPGVGENLHDHVSYVLQFSMNSDDIYTNNWAAATEYVAYQTGPMSASGASVGGMLSSSLTTSDYPDLSIFGTDDAASCAPGEIGALRSTRKRHINIEVSYNHAKSRGKVSLVSSNPLVYPNIWGNYLSVSTDIDALVEGVGKILTLAESKVMKAINLTLIDPQIAACSDYTFPSNEYWACAIKQNTRFTNRQAGSCKMGPASDELAVVDPELKVHGIDGLRVVDSSIIPALTSPAPGGATIMIAERGAAFIKAGLSG